ncbi:hypothetical protein TNCV_2915621 [Trichonephila clavipes]|nr:hypothetical protein TNCV_2915621 [Trichonephila clavipes]
MIQNSVQIPGVTSPTATYADSPRTPVQNSTCIRTCADSSVTSPTVTCADSTCIRTCANSSVTSRHYSHLCRVSQNLCSFSPELDILDPLESTDAFDQLMSFVFGPQELQLLHTVPSIFDENIFSFLDEREPMDLTMPRLNSCVKKSIRFKPIQPMDLSVNSCL